LHRLRSDPSAEVVGLVTSVVPTFDRVAMHGVRMSLLRAQAAAAQLPLLEVELPWPCTNDRYETAFAEALTFARQLWSVTHVAFGDLFLTEIRAYREALLARVGLAPLFPLWDEPTEPLLAAMLDGGLRARIVCLDPTRVDRDLAGRELDTALVAALPAAVDRCGERGEFHTFVTDGPMLDRPIPVMPGEVVERDGFVYADLLPEGLPARVGAS
jgi:diphthamide synthase (EF-2-diphthine--ammonia ligase)